MLNNLYRKLHILFASSVMLIITLVIFFVVANTVYTEKINESTLFQRLTTLLIYQAESDSSDMDKALKGGIPFIRVISHFQLLRTSCCMM